MATPLGEEIPPSPGRPRVTTRTSTSQATSTSLADQLPGTAQSLWVELGQDAVEAKGFWTHFDGSEPCPVAVNANASTDTETAKINQ